MSSHNNFAQPFHAFMDLTQGSLIHPPKAVEQAPRSPVLSPPQFDGGNSVPGETISMFSDFPAIEVTPELREQHNPPGTSTNLPNRLAKYTPIIPRQSETLLDDPFVVPYHEYAGLESQWQLPESQPQQNTLNWIPHFVIQELARGLRPLTSAQPYRREGLSTETAWKTLDAQTQIGYGQVSGQSPSYVPVAVIRSPPEEHTIAQFVNPLDTLKGLPQSFFEDDEELWANPFLPNPKGFLQSGKGSTQKHGATSRASKKQTQSTKHPKGGPRQSRDKAQKKTVRKSRRQQAGSPQQPFSELLRVATQTTENTAHTARSAYNTYQ
jgi:hypothetical protein